MRPPIVIDDNVFNDRVARLIATQGNAERAGVSLEEVGDMIYTRRMRINPSAGDPPAPKGKKEKITGAKLDDLLS